MTDDSGAKTPPPTSGGLLWLPITNIAFLLLILLVLLLLSMRIALFCQNSAAKDEKSDYYVELQTISDRTAAIQQALADKTKQDTKDFQSIEASLGQLDDKIDKLNGQLSKMQNSGNLTEVSRQLDVIRGEVATLEQSLTKLESVSSKKAIGLINIQSH